MDDLLFASATRQAETIRAREVSSEELVKACLARIEAVNPVLNAVVQLPRETALAQACQADAGLARGELVGPLHGVPFTLKDSIESAGVICTGGTEGRASFVPAEDATVVKRLRAAGGILLGKTNCPELGWAWEADNLIYGRTNNPYDPSLSSGGSSGGEAAIIAAGGSPLGLGSDAGGSVRFPAHCCGITALKPTRGRVPRTGHFPGPGGALDSLWQIGPLARFVEDLRLVLPIIAGVDWHDPAVVPMPLDTSGELDLRELRVAFHTDNGIATPSHETVEAVQRAAVTLNQAGMIVEDARPTGIEQTYETYLGLFTADGGAGIEALLEIAGTTRTHPLMQRALELQRASHKSAGEFAALLAWWDMFASSMLSFMEKYDVILCPVCAYPGMVHGMTYDMLPAFSYTMSYNLTGWPAAMVRGGWSPAGLPVGVQIVARPWRDDIALAVAQYLEEALGGYQRPPL